MIAIVAYVGGIIIILYSGTKRGIISRHSDCYEMPVAQVVKTILSYIGKADIADIIMDILGCISIQ